MSNEQLPTKEQCVANFWEVMSTVMADAILKGWNPQADLEFLGLTRQPPAA